MHITKAHGIDIDTCRNHILISKVNILNQISILTLVFTRPTINNISSNTALCIAQNRIADYLDT